MTEKTSGKKQQRGASSAPSPKASSPVHKVASPPPSLHPSPPEPSQPLRLSPPQSSRPEPSEPSASSAPQFSRPESSAEPSAPQSSRSESSAELSAPQSSLCTTGQSKDLLLIQRAEGLKLPSDWPLRFFKKSTQRPKRVKGQPKGSEAETPV